MGCSRGQLSRPRASCEPLRRSARGRESGMASVRWTGTDVSAVEPAVGASGIGHVIGPPLCSSSRCRGTRCCPPTRTAGMPDAPSVG